MFSLCEVSVFSLCKVCIFSMQSLISSLYFYATLFWIDPSLKFSDISYFEGHGINLIGRVTEIIASLFLAQV